MQQQALAMQQQLLDKGAPLDVQDEDGYTALHRAIMNHHTEVAQLLLDTGASLTIQTKYGDSAASGDRERPQGGGAASARQGHS